MLKNLKTGKEVIVSSETKKMPSRDKEPILAEIAKKGCPLELRHVNTLNFDWELTGIYYAEVKEEVKDLSKELRAKLFAEANKLVEEGKLEKAPAKNIKTADLEKLINENKE